MTATPNPPELPEPTEDEPADWARDWMPGFIEAFSATGIVAATCRHVGISRGTFYNWRRYDERFRLAIADAEEDAADALERVAHRRATIGEPVKKTVTRTYTNPSGELVTETTVTEETHISDRLLLSLLAARRPEKFRRGVVEVRGTGAGGTVPVEVREPKRTAERVRELLQIAAEHGVDLGVVLREDESDT